MFNTLNKKGSFPLKTADLVTFTEEILNGKLNFLCSDRILSTPLKFIFRFAVTNKFYLQILRFPKSCDVSSFISNLSLRVFNLQNRFKLTFIANYFAE